MKRTLYRVNTVPGTFDRATAIKHYRKLIAINKTTAELVNKCRKAGISTGGSINNLVGMISNIRFNFRGCFKNGYKEINRVDFPEIGPYYIESMTGQDLVSAIKMIRERVHNFRRSRRFTDPRGIHNEFGFWMKEKLRRVYRKLDQYKAPTDQDKYLGIEIEFIMPTDAKIKELLLPYAKYVTLGHDGSIDASEFNGSLHDADSCNNIDDCEDSHDGPEYEGRELRILLKASELNDILPKICQILVDIGGQVNKSCGLHVHFDMRNTLDSERESLYKKLYRSLPLLTQIVPKTRRENTFCVRNLRVKPSYSGSRYRMINATSYGKHRTFEIRLFNSTINATKIINWINLLQSIMSGAEVARCPKTFKKAQRVWEISNELVTWAEARQEKFKDPVVDVQDNNVEVTDTGMIVPRAETGRIVLASTQIMEVSNV